MPLLNYTTQVPAVRSVTEIAGMLQAHGARAIIQEFDQAKQIVGLSFEICHGEQTLAFRVPVKPDSVLKVLEREKMKNYRMRRSFTREQAVMIAWRIAKDWVEAQMALLETEMVDLEQIFLPYLVTASGKTLYTAISERGFLLPEGRG